jgi:hypothetical protein
VFLCKEWHVVATSDDDSDSGGPAMVSETPSKLPPLASTTSQSVTPSAASCEEGEDVNEELEVTAYFWQGRDAGPMPWLVFSFTASDTTHLSLSTPHHTTPTTLRPTLMTARAPF